MLRNCTSVPGGAPTPTSKAIQTTKTKCCSLDDPRSTIISSYGKDFQANLKRSNGTCRQLTTTVAFPAPSACAIPEAMERVGSIQTREPMRQYRRGPDGIGSS